MSKYFVVLIDHFNIFGEKLADRQSTCIDSFYVLLLNDSRSKVYIETVSTSDFSCRHSWLT